MTTKGAGAVFARRRCRSIVVRFKRHGFQTALYQLELSMTKEILTR